eukprot:NODE_2830_length_2137_cov_7.953234.p1 GENE.NODE_2830_length_2137_cov_7.953234~~NODE_2830_length_2137_cov_7.953234.p1  ORF type:complete len:399 (-),score=99.49 NODE_2830_length_2137_cov_7.953234:810-2006(-)
MAWNEDDRIFEAVHEALQPVAQGDTWEIQKLERRIRNYFKNAIKGMEFGRRPWQELINEYADSVFSSIFQALSDRRWLSQADFLLTLDAAVKEFFPKRIFENVPQHEFERTVLHAHDRAFEEQRCGPVIWDVLTRFVQDDPKSQKKLYNAAEAGRKAALTLPGAASANRMEDFMRQWIETTLSKLSTNTQGDLASIMSEAAAVQFFNALIEGGSCPLGLVAELGLPPKGWPFIATLVHEAYGRAAQEAAAWNVPTKAQRKAAARAQEALMYGPDGAWVGPQTPMLMPAMPPFMVVPNGVHAASAAWGSGSGVMPGQKRPAGLEPESEPEMKKAAPAPALAPPQRHPLCTQREDCLGDPTLPLVQHMDGSTFGDIYCSRCWTVFAEADSTLRARPHVLP